MMQGGWLPERTEDKNYLTNGYTPPHASQVSVCIHVHPVSYNIGYVVRTKLEILKLSLYCTMWNVHLHDTIFKHQIWENSFRRFWDTAFAKMGRMWSHGDFDIWPLNSKHLILKSKLTFMPDLKKFPPGVSVKQRQFQTKNVRLWLWWESLSPFVWNFVIADRGPEKGF